MPSLMGKSEGRRRTRSPPSMLPGSKYGSKKARADGITFHSKRERDRYLELKVLERAGEIADLEIQPNFEILPVVKYRGETLRHRCYVADFKYRETVTGEIVVEDVKSPPTRKKETYRLKRQMFLQLYGDAYKFIET